MYLYSLLFILRSDEPPMSGFWAEPYLSVFFLSTFSHLFFKTIIKVYIT